MRKTVHSYTVFNAVDATTTQTSEKTVVQGIDKLSYHVKFSANNAGTFNVQAQNSDSDTWVNISFNAVMTIAAENEALIIMNEVPFKNLRLVWTPSAGSGTMTAILNMRAVGS
jgi:hypothetical protein